MMNVTVTNHIYVIILFEKFKSQTHLYIIKFFKKPHIYYNRFQTKVAEIVARNINIISCLSNYGDDTSERLMKKRASFGA